MIKESIPKTNDSKDNNREQKVQELVDRLWHENPQLYEMIKSCMNVEDARKHMYKYLRNVMRQINHGDSNIPRLEQVLVEDAVEILRRFLAIRNELLTKTSVITIMYRLAQGEVHSKFHLKEGFVQELIHLFRAVHFKSNIYQEDKKIQNEILNKGHLIGREAAIHRSAMLDRITSKQDNALKDYPNGLSEEVIQKRKENVKRICSYYNVSEEEFYDYKWQLRNIIVDYEVLKELVTLTDDEKESIKMTNKESVPFGITPYYLSLFDNEDIGKRDRAVRAQVLPPKTYLDEFVKTRGASIDELDFMGERDTSPIDLVTRRYPSIAIFKPYNTCAQICVYCQRNWEIDSPMSPKALAPKEKIDAAIEWFRNTPAVKEVLITGGDPLLLSDSRLDDILGRLSKIEHIERIRLGTRTFVVLPMRITDDFIDILKKYHEPGRRDITMVTHFQHPYEVTPETMEGVQKIRKLGISCYNQTVFTFHNSRKYEQVAHRKSLKLIGVDPYYTFNAKGKDETKDYRVPIARILQEAKEEQRLLPGVMRTDEPVFNVPRLGKNYLRAAQHRDWIMIAPNGSRIWEFHPWEKNIALTDTYVFHDVPIANYLRRLKRDGEDISKYRTIWYYY